MEKFNVMTNICKRAVLVQEYNICSWKNYTIKYYNAPHRENEIFIIIKGVNNEYICELDKNTCKIIEACSRYEEFKEKESLIAHTQEIMTKVCNLAQDKLQLIIKFVEDFER